MVIIIIRANKAFYFYCKNNGFNLKSCYISDEYYKITKEKRNN